MVKKPAEDEKSRFAALPVMSGAVTLQVLGAVLLKVLADQVHVAITIWIVAGVGGVILLNVLRLVVWGYAHRRFPLSMTFPISSLFFPCMLLVALAFGDPIGARQVAGAVLITLGVIWLSYKAG